MVFNEIRLKTVNSPVCKEVKKKKKVSYIHHIHKAIIQCEHYGVLQDSGFIDYAKTFDCVDHNKLWKILKEMGIPDHLTCILRNLYAGQMATHSSTLAWRIPWREEPGRLESMRS